jgi:excisionase family DNA binding protein
MTLSIELPPDFAEHIARHLADMVRPEPAGRGGPYLDVNEAARYLACDKDRIYDLKALGRLRHVRDGRRLLFKREWLDAALEDVAVG